MKKSIAFLVIMIFCICLVSLPGCSSGYKRISFGDDIELGEFISDHIDKDTKVTCNAKGELPSTLPIYEISKRIITDNEYKETLAQLEIDEDRSASSKLHIRREENVLHIEVDDVLTSSRGDFDLTEAELEMKAREVLTKLPFIEGAYEYTGMQASYTRTDAEGTHILSGGASFRRVMDDIKILGNDRCYIYFDGSGLVELYVELYEYEKIGTMELIPLESASKRILDPDMFSIEKGEDTTQIGLIDVLLIDRIELRYVNQYSRGCTILQPVYSYIGTATDKNGAQADCVSVVIAASDSLFDERKG